MKNLLLTFAVAVFGSAVCFGGTKTIPVKLGKDKSVTPAEELFRGNEFDVSIYGAVGVGRVDHYDNHDTSQITLNRQGVPQQGNTYIPIRGLPQIQTTTTSTTRHNVSSAFGGGVEADYFFTRYFGLGVEGDWLAGRDVISAVSGNLIGRYPFEYGTWGWAPYGFLGGGGQFDSQNAGFGQIGAGAEVRFKSNWGIFTDARWILHDVYIDYALIRAGIRFNF